MKRYKISKENLNEFWGWFGKKKPQTMQQVIDNDPVLNKLDAELADINKSYIPKLKKMQNLIFSRKCMNILRILHHVPCSIY
jgi:hypothetical protein